MDDLTRAPKTRAPAGALEQHSEPQPASRIRSSARPQSARQIPASRTPRHDAIGEGLRRLWADVEKEPVPDDFLDILDRIDAANPVDPGPGDPGEGGKA